MKEEILSIASDLREGSMTTNEAKRQLLLLFSGSVLYKGYKIIESLQGFDVNVYDGSEWRYLFSKSNESECRDFIDRFLKTDR